jgi:antitoxin ParD1/3/4
MSGIPCVIRCFMNLTIKPELEDFIRQEMLSGKYASPNEVIEAALSLLEHKNLADTWAAEIGDKIDVAVAQLDRGEGLDGQEVVDRLRSKLRAAKESR